MNNLVQISRRSFLALRSAMNVTGQNVANADSEGYTRRRVTLQSESTTSPGVIVRTRPGTATGAGVSIGTYERVRDALLTASTWDAQTALGGAEQDHRLLSALEGLFPTGEGSLDGQLSAFWNAWSDVADHPTDQGVRVALRSKASELTDTFNRTSGDLEAFAAETVSDLRGGVDRVNALLTEIAEINTSTESARLSGTPDLDAEDRRDLLVKELSAFGPVRVTPEEGKGYTVTLNGMTVVQAENVVGLNVETDPGGANPRVVFGSTGVAFQAQAGSDGKLGAWLRTLNETIPDTQATLDTIAETLVTEVNARQSAGVGLDGSTGNDFFDAAGTTAGTLSLSAAVLGDAGVIAASGDATAMGDNSVASDIAGLSTATVMGGGTESMSDTAIDLVTGIGASVRKASAQASANEAVAGHLEAMERGVSGVSLDEEMTNLIKYQQAFAATARVLETAQQMMDTLLAL